MTEPDDLESLLEPPPAVSSTALRESIRAQTERVLQRRHVVRIGSRIGVVAAVFFVGLGVGSLSQPGPLVLRDNLLRMRPTLVVPVLIPIPGNEPVASPEEPVPASRLEVQAEQIEDRGVAAKLYRTAGDRYYDEQDFRNAARCYRLYLARAGDPALQPESQDNWLLTSLKNAAFQEKFNVAKSNG